MGSAVSLSHLSGNPTLKALVSEVTVNTSDEVWNNLLSFSHVPSTDTVAECKLIEDAARPLLDALLKNNHVSGNLRTLVAMFIKETVAISDSNGGDKSSACLRARNALFIIRVALKHIIERHSEAEAILHLDGSKTIPLTQSSSAALAKDINLPDKPVFDTLAEQTANNLVSPVDSGLTIKAISKLDSLVSWKLVECVVNLLNNVVLSAATYDIHLEAVNFLLVCLSCQVRPKIACGIFLQHILTVSNDMCTVLVQRLLSHVISQPPSASPSGEPGLLSSVTTGIWSIVTLNRGGGSPEHASSPLADDSLLLLLVLAHQQAGGHNPYRAALCSLAGKRGGLSLEKIYLTLCSKLNGGHHTLLLYLLLQGNSEFASFVFSRADIDNLVVPLLKQLHDCGSESSHHVYMLLIILLILSQDECFNKSLHTKVLSSVPWYTERKLSTITLGSVMAMVLLKTVQVNITHIRDKYLHTNCLAALANMSAHFHSLHLDAARKLVNLFKLLGKKHQRVSDRLGKSPSLPAASSLQPTDQDNATDCGILEEVLQMVLEIINSCLTHNLHNNPHLVYSLLYQREIFEAYRSHPNLMDLVQNIETVVSFFSTKLEQSGPSPYSPEYVLSTIEQAAKSWPKARLRVFPELKFRYIEEDQPEAFFIPYIWTLVFKHSTIYWDSTTVNFS